MPQGAAGGPQGPQGAKGAQGAPGAQGAQGPAGATQGLGEINNSSHITTLTNSLQVVDEIVTPTSSGDWVINAAADIYGVNPYAYCEIVQDNPLAASSQRIVATKPLYVGGDWNLGSAAVNVDTNDNAVVFASQEGFTYLECANDGAGTGEAFTTEMTATRVTAGAANTFTPAARVGKRSPAAPRLPAAKPQ